jgi:hypothetical protein
MKKLTRVVTTSTALLSLFSCSRGAADTRVARPADTQTLSRWSPPVDLFELVSVDGQPMPIDYAEDKSANCATRRMSEVILIKGDRWMSFDSLETRCPARQDQPRNASRERSGYIVRDGDAIRLEAYDPATKSSFQHVAGVLTRDTLTAGSEADPPLRRYVRKRTP